MKELGSQGLLPLGQGDGGGKQGPLTRISDDSASPGSFL